MALDSRHPAYQAYVDKWLLMERSYLGEDAIKAVDDFNNSVQSGALNISSANPVDGTTYLPATQAMVNKGMGGNAVGRQMYDAYKRRAVYPELIRAAVETLIGVLWHKPSVFELPAALEPLRDNATLQGAGLEALLRKIHEQVLVPGRFGLLLDLDIDEFGVARPYIATYNAISILNWDVGRRDDVNARATLNLVVLDETEQERTTQFEWRTVEKFRVLVLGDPIADEDVTSQDGGPLYRVASVRESRNIPADNAYVTPSIRGQALNQIPFVFINSKDTLPDPETPPLKPLANLALTIYRGEADYRQSLFMQSQDTLVVVGRDPDAGDVQIGAGATISLPMGGDAKYVGVSGAGLGEQRTALENDRKEAAKLAGELIDTRSRQKESAAALGIRTAAQTVSLNQIALTSANALETILKIAAVWIGADPEEVRVTPNLEFIGQEDFTAALVQLMTAKSTGAPISRESIHELMVEKGLTQKTFEEEMALIDGEEPVGPTVDTGLNAGGPNDKTSAAGGAGV